MAILFIILKTFTSLLEGIIIKKYNSKYSGGGFLFTAITALFSMLFFVIIDRNGFEFPLQLLPYGIFSGVCYSSASVFTYIALGCGSFTLTMLILSYALVFSVVYGIAFLNEQVTLLTCIGFLLIIVSIYLVNGNSEKSEQKKVISPIWLAAMLVSFVGSGLFGVLSRAQQIRFNDVYTNEFMIITLGFSAVALFTIGFIKDRKNAIMTFKHGGIYAAMAGIANGATNMIGMIVTMLIPISISSPLSAGFKILISFLCSCFVFKEHFKKKQIAGVVLGTIALVVFNI